MSEDCCAPGTQWMILACSGGSNVGQIANQVAVDLTVEGLGKMFCLAGIGGEVERIVQSTRDTERILAIDGCPLGCAQKALERMGITHHRTLVLTDLGIEKTENLPLEDEQVQSASQAARRIVVKSDWDDRPSWESEKRE
jgi:uncharacterized metal-binding protein